MALAVNLRADFAKLSDTELAERLEAAWAKHDSRTQRLGWFQSRISSFRSPIRHPRAHRFFWGMSAMKSGHWIELLFPLVMSSKATDDLVNAIDDPYLNVCEIRDMMDEIKRRVDARKAAA